MLSKVLIMSYMNLIVLTSTYTNYFNRIIWYSPYFCVPFLYKTEINSLARVTKIKDMVKNGAYNYITNHNRPVYTSDTFLYEFYSDWVPSPAMPLVNL